MTLETQVLCQGHMQRRRGITRLEAKKSRQHQAEEDWKDDCNEAEQQKTNDQFVPRAGPDMVTCVLGVRLPSWMT